MPQMTRTPVSSSSIASIGHDGDTTLHVEFSSGALYEYPDVDADTHAKLIGADSVGQHFAKHIRPHFEGRRIG